MYRNAYQRGMLTVFFSGGSKPLAIWDVHTQDGYVSRFLDQDIKSMVLEIGGTNVSTSYITCPKGKVVLGITMPFLVMIVKNLKKYFSFEVTILDETSTRRRFRVSNFQSTTQILPLCTAMPIGLSDGWNQIQFNLAEFTRRAYKKQFVEVQKLKINANIRIRRIYFTERLLPEDELPPEYKLYFPLSSKGTKDKKTATKEITDKENIKPSTSQPEVKAPEAVPVEKVKSEVTVLKPASKASVHSIKKASSHESRKPSQAEVIPEGEATAEPTEVPEGVSEKTEVTEEQAPVEDKNLETGVEEDPNAVEQAAPEEPKDTEQPPQVTEEPPNEVTETEPAPEPEAEPVADEPQAAES